MSPGDAISFNLTDQFVDRHIREGHGQKVAIRCDESVYTYDVLAADVNRAGNGLLRLGLQREQRVLLLLPDCPEFAVAYFGVIKIGAVAIPTSTAARTADYDYFLRESKARTLIVHSTLFAEVAPALGAQHFLRHVIVVGELQPGCKHWNEWLAQNSSELDGAMHLCYPSMVGRALFYFRARRKPKRYYELLRAPGRRFSSLFQLCMPRC